MEQCLLQYVDERLSRKILEQARSQQEELESEHGLSAPGRYVNYTLTLELQDNLCQNVFPGKLLFMSSIPVIRIDGNANIPVYMYIIYICVCVCRVYIYVCV